MEEKEASTKQYEITYLMTPQLSEEEILKLGQKIKSDIENLDGRIKKELGPKKQKLAYSIKKAKNAYVSTLNFELPPQKIEELNKRLKLEEKLLRHLIIIRLPFKALVGKRRPGKGIISPLPPLPPKPAEEKAEKKPEELPPKKEIKIEELDKKLKEILEG